MFPNAELAFQGDFTVHNNTQHNQNGLEAEAFTIKNEITQFVDESTRIPYNVKSSS